MSDNAVFRALRNFHERHERVKKFVHEGMRVPLPRWGRFLMGCVYFTIPVVGGLSIMNWSIGKAHESIGEDGERLPVKTLHGLGDTVVGDDGTRQRVGAGGWGGGVHLAVSDEENQRSNREALNKFFKQQQRRRKAQEKQNEEEKDQAS